MFDSGVSALVQDLNKYHPWEDWFAWHPVTTISGHRVWGKKISRRLKMKYGDQRLYSEWEYGTLFDMLEDK